MSLSTQLDIAKAYTSQCDSAMEIDKEKGVVYLLDHITREWVSAETILNKYFERVETSK